jgi:stearoyl-CoA desaturase (delta-9 desaturase)
MLLINPMLFLFGFCLPVVFAFHGYGLVNLIPHTENGNPKNSWVANILTAGEGWHKNHHEDSRNWRIGKTLWQWDPGAWFIKIIKR